MLRVGALLLYEQKNCSGVSIDCLSDVTQDFRQFANGNNVKIKRSPTLRMPLRETR